MIESDIEADDDATLYLEKELLGMEEGDLESIRRDVRVHFKTNDENLSPENSERESETLHFCTIIQEIIKKYDLENKNKKKPVDARHAPFYAIDNEPLVIDIRQITDSQDKDKYKIALGKVIEINQGLVIKIARKHLSNNGLTLSDLINEGNIGLIRAAQMFDPTRGYKFSTYAVPWIRMTMGREKMVQLGIVSLPYKKRQAMVMEKVNRCSDFSSTPIKVPEELRVLAQHDSIVSLDAFGSGEPFVNTLRDPKEVPFSDIIDREKMNGILEKALKTHLSMREEKIISMRFGLNGDDEETLNAIGAEFGITKERVRQIQKEVLKKLRGILKAQGMNFADILSE